MSGSRASGSDRIGDPFGPFTEETTGHDGLISARKLASALQQPMAVIAPALGFKPRWLNENPTAAKAQRNASLLLRTINAIAYALGSTQSAIRYLNTEQPDFKGETPADQLRRGRLEYLAGYIDELVTLRPD